LRICWKKEGKTFACRARTANSLCKQSLRKIMEETRRAHHDLQHHLNAMQGYLDSGNLEKLREYIEEHTKRLADISAKQYSKNPMVDTILRYYADRILLLQIKIGKTWMMKKRDNTVGIMLKGSHKGLNFVRDIGSCVRKPSGMYRELQRMVEILIRIILRSVWGQKEHLDFLPMPFQPSCDEFPVVNFQIIQNKEYLLPRQTNQTTHKFDESLLVHCISINHKTDVPLITDRCYHVDSFPFCFYR